jgi:hypothetical protein
MQNAKPELLDFLNFLGSLEERRWTEEQKSLPHRLASSRASLVTSFRQNKIFNRQPLQNQHLPYSHLPIATMPKSKGVSGDNDKITDPRFTSFETDPRFRLPSKKHTRTKIDKRFAKLLTDDDFSSTAKVDRYGRKLSSDGKKKALQRLYVPDEEEQSEDEDEADAPKLRKPGKKSRDDDEDFEVDVEDDETIRKEMQRVAYGKPYLSGKLEFLGLFYKCS